MERCPTITVLPTSSLQGPDLPRLPDHQLAKHLMKCRQLKRATELSLPFEQEAVVPWKPQPINS